jgi:hypothetical protein
MQLLLEQVSVNFTQEYLVGLQSEDNPERFASFGFSGTGFLQEVDFDYSFSKNDILKIRSGQNPSNGYKVFKSGIRTKLKFRCEYC